MKLIDKLTLGHLTVGLLVIVVALVGISAINNINFAFNEVSTETLPTIKALEDARAAGLRIVVSTSEFVSIKAESEHNETATGVVEKEHVISGIKQYDEAISRYEDLVKKFFPREKDFLENIKNSGKKLQNASNEIIVLKEQGVSGSIILEKQDEFETAEQEFLKAINDAIANEDKEFADRNQNVNHAIATSVQNILIAGLLTFIIAIVLGVNISKSISKPILELRNAAVDIGNGKLDKRVDIKSDDEVGVLTACFNQMAQRLKHNIEEINKVETEVRESEEKFRLVFENARDAIFWSDPESGLIVRCNKAAENLLEKENREIVGHHQSTLHSPEKAEFYADQFKRHFQDKVSVDEEAEVITKSGKLKSVQISASVTTVKGKPIMQGIFRDITERKRAEKALWESEEKYRALMDNAGDAIILMDIQGNLLEINRLTESLFGRKNEEVFNEHFSRFIPEMELKRTNAAFEALIQNGSGVLSDINLLKKDGTMVPVDMNGTIIQYAGKKVAQVIFRDITERKKAEEGLKESEEMYRTIIEFSNDMIWTADMLGRFQFCNRHAEEISGYKLEEWRDKAYFSLIVGEELPNLMEIFSKILKGQPQQYEATVKKRDGTALILSINTAPIYSKGAMIGTVSFGRDITQHKKADEALKESERELKESQRVAQVGSWQWIIASDTISWSEGYYRIIGRDVALPPPNYAEHLKMYTPGSAARLEAAVSDALNGTPYELDLELLHPDGSQRFMIARGEAVRDAAGQVVMLRGTLQDITQRKLAEEALRESEEKYRNLVERSNDGILIIQDGLVKFVNVRLAQLWGGSAEELLETPIMRHIHPDERDKVMGRYQLRMANEKIPPIYETILMLKDGNSVHIEINAGFISYKGKPADLVMIRDITERRRTEELRLENERLVLANRAKSEFLAVMSHELRTPLNAVIGFSELLKRGMAGELNEKQEHYVDNALASGKHLLDLINNILEIARLENESMQLVIEKISVPEAINEAAALIKADATKRNVILSINLDPQLDIIEADRIKFRQILYNLIGNAVKFSKPEGGTVTITTEKSDGMAKISISDTGIGIKEKDMEKLFSLFQQLDSGFSRTHGGVGLGLAISKQFVELHGGNIMVRSKYGEGSTFTFLLPIEAKKKDVQ